MDSRGESTDDLDGSQATEKKNFVFNPSTDGSAQAAGGIGSFPVAAICRSGINRPPSQDFIVHGEKARRRCAHLDFSTRWDRNIGERLNRLGEFDGT
jgi:hypothetical protein